MRSTTIFALFAAVALPALGAKNPDVDLVDVEQAIEEAYPEFHNGLSKYASAPKAAFLNRANHVNYASQPRGTALLKHAHHVSHHHRRHHAHHGFYNPDLPNRHPSVEKALDGMHGEIDRLREAKLAATNARGELQNKVTDTIQKMNQARAIKYAMAKEESRLRLENGKLTRLESDAGRLEETHDSLVTSLHRMLGPKMMLAKKRFDKKDAVLKKEENAVMAWKEKRDQLKEKATALITKKKASYQSLLEAEEAVARAKKAEQLARIEYEHDRAQTAEEVQGYHYAETRYKAELQHEKTAREAAEAAHATMEKLANVEQEEETKVDETILVRRAKLQRKMQKIEAVKEKDSETLGELEQKYKDWKEKQQERAAEVLRKKQEAEAAAEVHASRQKEVLESAQRRVANEADDDWGNWN